MEERTRATREQGQSRGRWPWSAALALGVTVATAAAVAGVSLTGSPWPLVPLVPLLVLVAGVPAPRPERLAICGSLAVLVVVAGVITGTVAAASLLGASVVVALAAAAWWDRERTESAGRILAARQLADAVSVVDEVTGCYNASGLDLLARHVLGAVRRSSGAMHASLVEVADLAAVADVGGADAVREVVCAVADALRDSTRGADVVGRWSSDVFVVLGPGTGVTPAELERRLRGKLVAAAGRPTTRWACAVTVGSGLLEPWDGGGLAELVSRAEQDLALRRALRAPSAAEPVRRSRRAADRAAREAGASTAPVVDPLPPVPPDHSRDAS